MNRLKEILVERGTVSGERKDPIQALLDDPAVSEIFINGPLDIYTRQGGKTKKEHTSFADHEHIKETLGRIADETAYKVTKTETTVIIEKRKLLDRKALDHNQSLAGGIGEMLALFVKAKANIAITGLPGMLKSTLLDTLLDQTGNSRLVVIDPKGEIRPRANAVILRSAGTALGEAQRLKAETIAINDTPSHLPELLDIMLSGINCIFTIQAPTGKSARDLLLLKTAETYPHVPFVKLQRMIHQTMDAVVLMGYYLGDGPVVEEVNAFAVYSSIYKKGTELCMPELAGYGGTYDAPVIASSFLNKDGGIPARLRRKLSRAGIKNEQLVSKFSRERSNDYL